MYEAPLFARPDGSLVVTKCGRPYHIPTEWAEEFALVMMLVANGTLPEPVAEGA